MIQEYKDQKMPNRFSAPIPGESLTKPVGGAPYERPPQFADMDEALEYLFSTMTDPKSVAYIVHILESGGTVEALVRTILFKGFMDGKWTVDLALLMAKIMVPMVAAIAVQAGIPETKIRVKNPDAAFAKFVRDTKNKIPNGDILNGEQPSQLS